MDHTLEKVLFASRWLMAPFYMGLVGALVILLISFLKELFYYFGKLASLEMNDAVMAALALIDLSLAANLLLIVIFSGYENFVSKMDIGDHKDRPEWMGTVDFSGLKLKLVASIVAISGIHLLKVFMDIEKVSERQIQWMVIIHIVFIFSGVMLALMDRITADSKSKKYS